MRIDELVAEPEREEHIAEHNVSIEEAEEVAYGEHFATRAKHRYYRLIGQTSGGRYLTVFVAPRGESIFSLVTARDATQRERQAYQAHRRN